MAVSLSLWKLCPVIFTHKGCISKFIIVTQKAFFSQEIKPYYVTTPIFYVNSNPHLGHLYTVVLADVAQRFQKLLDPSTICLLSTGTDEHGLKIQQAAALAGKSPIEFCTNISSSYSNLFDKTSIQYSDFIRTTEVRHKKAVESFFNVIYERGFIYKDKYESWYCVADETFLTESQIKKNELPDGRIVVTSLESGHPVEWSSEINYIFRLSKFQEELLYWLKEERIVPSRFQEELTLWISKGLNDLSISRPQSRVSWGIPLPCDPSHSVYVWFDALVNYLTVVGYPYCTHWPPNLQIIGKDILRFHGIYWPAMLMAAGLEPPQKLLVHSHWKVDGEKMSKSKGNVICPISLLDKFSTDGVRYLLLRKGTPHSDGSWNDAKAIDYVNAELANTFGNLVRRCTPLSLNPEKVFPPVCKTYLLSPSSTCQSLINQMENLPRVVKHHYLNYNYYLGIEAIMSMLRTANLFFDEEKPWELKNNVNKVHLESILSICLTAAKFAAISLQPIIPSLSDNLLNYLSIPINERSWHYLEKFQFKSVPTKLATSDILFKRIK